MQSCARHHATHGIRANGPSRMAWLHAVCALSRCSSLRCHRLSDTRCPRHTWRSIGATQRNTMQRCEYCECCAYFRAYFLNRIPRVAWRRQLWQRTAQRLSGLRFASVALPSAAVQGSGRIRIDPAGPPQALDGNTTNDDSKLSYDVSRCGTPCLHSSTVPRIPESAVNTGAPYREYCSAPQG